MDVRDCRAHARRLGSPLSHESTSSSESSRADRTRISEFISRRKAQVPTEPGEVKENQYLPDTEVSFSKDNFEAGEAPITRRQKTRSPSSTSSTSTSDLQDLNAEIRRMLRGVLAQINPSTPTLHSGSYSASMILKKLKEKLEALERLGKNLDDHRKALEAVERQTQSRLSAVKRLEDSLEAKDRAHSEALKRIQSLEQALEEARSSASLCSQSRVEKMEEDLKAAALQLEQRTYDLLQEERELEAKDAELQRRTAALVKLEKELTRRKAALDSEDTPQRFCRAILGEIAAAAENEAMRQQAAALIQELQSDVDACRVLKGSLQGGRDEGELLRREQDLVRRETALRKDTLALARREAELSRRLKTLAEREQSLAGHEERCRQKEDASEPVDDQQAKASKMWETVLLKLEHVQKAEKRLEAAKAEFLQQSQRIQETQRREDERLALWEATLRSSSSGDKDGEIRLLRSELCAKDGLLQAKDSELQEQRAFLEQAEAALEAKSKEMEALVSGISKSLQSSPRKRTSEELQEFALTYRQRQEALRRHIDAADDEKREMCQTLKELLSDLT